MNPSLSQFTTINPYICKMWEMVDVLSESKLKSNSNRHYLNFETQYGLSVAYGKKYVKEPFLDYIRFGKLVERYSLDKFIHMMNVGEERNYMDLNGEFKFSECIKYSELSGLVYLSIEEYLKGYSTIEDVSNVDSLYTYTNLQYVNIRTTRNAIACLDDTDCIINFCHDRGNRWMYNPQTQLCYYPIDSTTVPSDDKMFFSN